MKYYLFPQTNCLICWKHCYEYKFQTTKRYTNIVDWLNIKYADKECENSKLVTLLKHCDPVGYMKRMKLRYHERCYEKLSTYNKEIFEQKWTSDLSAPSKNESILLDLPSLKEEKVNNIPSDISTKYNIILTRPAELAVEKDDALSLPKLYFTKCFYCQNEVDASEPNTILHKIMEPRYLEQARQLENSSVFALLTCAIKTGYQLCIHIKCREQFEVDYHNYLLRDTIPDRRANVLAEMANVVAQSYDPVEVSKLYDYYMSRIKRKNLRSDDWTPPEEADFITLLLDTYKDLFCVKTIPADDKQPTTSSGNSVDVNDNANGNDGAVSSDGAVGGKRYFCRTDKVPLLRLMHAALRPDMATLGIAGCLEHHLCEAAKLVSSTKPDGIEKFIDKVLDEWEKYSMEEEYEMYKGYDDIVLQDDQRVRPMYGEDFDKYFEKIERDGNTVWRMNVELFDWSNEEVEPAVKKNRLTESGDEGTEGVQDNEDDIAVDRKPRQSKRRRTKENEVDSVVVSEIESAKACADNESNGGGVAPDDNSNRTVVSELEKAPFDGKSSKNCVPVDQNCDDTVVKEIEIGETGVAGASSEDDITGDDNNTNDTVVKETAAGQTQIVAAISEEAGTVDTISDEKQGSDQCDSATTNSRELTNVE